MKTKISLLILTFLSSGCYTYRNVDLSSQRAELGEKYKIETTGPTKWSGSVVQFNDSLIFLQTTNKAVVPIPLSKIIKVRQGKFSYGKTIALSASTLGVGVLIIALISVRNLEADLSNWELQF